MKICASISREDHSPLLTTKRVSWKTIVRELLWFLSGETNIRPLLEQGVTIWTDWPLARYRRDTGDEIGQAEFEARIVADEILRGDGATSGPSMAASGGAGRAIGSTATGSIGATSRASTRSPG